MTRSACLVAAIAILFAAGAHAEVTRVEVKTRADIGATGYEKLQKGHLLADDVSRVMQRAGDTSDLVVRDAGTQP